MTQYLLSTHCAVDDVREPVAPEAMQRSFEEITRLEEEMRSTGTWVFGGRLHEPDTATVVRMASGEVVTTDGPYLESKEHLGGFYVIDAADLDAALAWAGRVTALIGSPIEVRPFAGSPEG
jgi:hypothetical protein